MNRRAREFVARLVIVELDSYPSSSPGWTINVSKTLGQARYLVKYDYGVGQRFESYMELSLIITHTAGKLTSFSGVAELSAPSLTYPSRLD